MFARKNVKPEIEYLQRDLATRSLMDFTTYTYPEYWPEDFHIDLANHLERIIEGDIKKLLIIAPPQHGKSELTSVRLPAYWFSKHPELPVILCSYGATLAWEKRTRAMNIIYSQDYLNLFPKIFKPKPRWIRSPHTHILKHQNSVIYSAGVRGAITGRGGGLGIIDDPVKDWLDAYSSNKRESTWQWWRGTFRSRIWADGRIILIMTRWHEDDLAGRILNDSGEKWTVVRYPALCEEPDERLSYNNKYLAQGLISDEDPLGRFTGDPLCPHKFPLNSLLDIKKDVGSRAWYAEYQGTPKPLEGFFIKQEWIHVVETYPIDDIIKYVRYWDKAATEAGGCKTAGVLLGATKQKTYYLINAVVGQWSPFQREEIIKQVCQEDNEKYTTSKTIVETWFEHEGGSGGVDSAVASIKNLAGYHVRAEHPKGGKMARLEPCVVQMEAGNFFILQGKWTWEVVDELLMWPNGHFKDIGDALSGAFRKVVSGGWSRSGE